MEVYKTLEEWDGEKNPKTITPGVYKLELGEHTSTHVDAINHMAKEYVGQSIDTMPLSMFYTEGICVDLSYKGLSELISIQEIKEALTRDNLNIKQGDTLLI